MIGQHLPPPIQRLGAWLALVVVLLQALLPVLSHAVMLNTAQERGWVEVCTVSGMAWVRLATATEMADAQEDSAVPPPSSVLVHGCEWCATHPPLTALPPTSFASPIVLTDWATHPPAFFHAPRLLAVWTSAHSRAPPVLA
jgi:hypothetical protein